VNTEDVRHSNCPTDDGERSFCQDNGGWKYSLSAVLTRLSSEVLCSTERSRAAASRDHGIVTARFAICPSLFNVPVPIEVNVAQTIPDCDLGRTRVGAGPPFSTASTLSRASMPIAVRVSIVALPICGNRNVFFSETYSG
jgi:hypothetical protein